MSFHRPACFFSFHVSVPTTSLSLLDWTVAVAVSGNAVGLSLAQWQQLSPQQQAERREQACASLAVAQADFVIDSVAELPPVLEDINRLLASGQRPRGAPVQPA